MKTSTDKLHKITKRLPRHSASARIQEIAADAGVAASAFTLESATPRLRQKQIATSGKFDPVSVVKSQLQVAITSLDQGDTR